MFLSAFFIGTRIVVRLSMLKNLNEEKITTIRIAENELRWYQKNHEILVDGKMFDVKSFKLVSGFYEITGLFDDMETELNALLKNLQDDANSSQDQQLNLYKACLGLVCVNEESNVDNSVNTINETRSNVEINDRLSTGYNTPFFTPPRSC